MTDNTLQGRTLLYVNTGLIKKKFILQRLKKLGVTIVCLNKEKNWAVPYVDEWILADTDNHQECLRAVVSYMRITRRSKPEGVLTFWENDVLLTAKLIDALHFAGVPFAVAK